MLNFSPNQLLFIRLNNEIRNEISMVVLCVISPVITASPDFPDQWGPDSKAEDRLIKIPAKAVNFLLVLLPLVRFQIIDQGTPIWLNFDRIAVYDDLSVFTLELVNLLAVSFIQGDLGFNSW